MKHNRLWLIIPWAAFTLIVVAWCGYWLTVADRAERQVRAWAAEQSANGGQADITAIKRHGFPVLMRLELQGVHYSPARANWRLDTDRVDLNIEMLNPAHVILASKAPIQIWRGENEFSVIDSRNLIASVETRDGRLHLAGIEADDLSVDDPTKDGVLRVAKLVMNVRPDPRADGDFQIAFDATEVNLPRPVRSFESFGLALAQLRAAIVATHGASLFDSAPGDALGPWRDAGGVFRLEALTLNWGPLEATGTGQIGVDAQHRLAGHLTLPIANPAPVFHALANSEHVDPNARQAIGMIAASYEISGNSIDLDADAADGVLRLGRSQRANAAARILNARIRTKHAHALDAAAHRFDARIIRRDEALDAHQRTRLRARDFLAAEPCITQRALRAVVRIVEHHQCHVAACGIGRTGGEHASLRRIPDRPRDRQASDQIQFVKARFRKRRPPRAHIRRRRPRHHRNARLRIFQHAHQSLLRLTNVSDARTGAKMTPRNIEQPRRIVTRAANDNINNALAPRACRAQTAPKLDDQFRLGAARVFQQIAQHLNFATGPKRRTVCARNSKAFGQTQTLRNEREHGLIHALNLLSDRSTRRIVGGRPAIIHAGT